MTKQRLLIKDIICSSDMHLTAEEIYSLAKNKMPSIALGTVYRNLGKLCENKEIRLISSKGFPDRYDRSVIPHGHLICDGCGKVSDFPLTDISELIKSELKEDVIYYDINAHYVCENCRK